MKEKAEGATDKCFCGTEVICRVKPASDDGKYPEKLQWQNHDGKAHYNYDFKTKTTTCNSQVQQEQQSENHTLDQKASSDQLDSVNERLDTMQGILQSILKIVVDLKTQQNNAEKEQELP